MALRVVSVEGRVVTYTLTLERSCYDNPAVCHCPPLLSHSLYQQQDYEEIANEVGAGADGAEGEGDAAVEA